MKKFSCICLIITIILFSLVGCSNVTEPPNLKDKVTSELEYIESNLIGILDKFAKDEYIKDDILDWNKILEDVKKVQNEMAVTLVDLATLNINAEDVSKLSTGIDNMIIMADKRDINSFLVELNNTYALIPSYMESYGAREENAFKKRIRYYVISSYVAYIEKDLETAKSQVSELEKSYSSKMQEIDYIKNNEYNMNKIYILIQEYKKAIEADSSELVKSKYLLTITEI